MEKDDIVWPLRLKESAEAAQTNWPGPAGEWLQEEFDELMWACDKVARMGLRTFTCSVSSPDIWQMCVAAGLRVEGRVERGQRWDFGGHAAVANGIALLVTDEDRIILTISW